MKTEKQIKEMQEFISYFNDKLLLNPDYREGVLDAFYFVLYNWEGRLDRFRKGMNE